MRRKKQDRQPGDSRAFGEVSGEQKNSDRTGEEQKESGNAIGDWIQSRKRKQCRPERPLRQWPVPGALVDSRESREKLADRVIAISHPPEAVTHEKMSRIVEEDRDLRKS